MNKKHYLSPEIDVVSIEQEGIICGSDNLNVGTGASWGVEDPESDEGFIL